MRAFWIGGIGLLFVTQIALADGPNPPSPWMTKSAGIIGRVFVDHDGDGVWSESDEGLNGVRLVTDTGRVAITGPDGRFHFLLMDTGYELVGSHVIKLDRSTLPSGASLMSSHRRLVELAPMEIRWVDFAVRHSMKIPFLGRGVAPAGRDVPPLLQPDLSGTLLTTYLAGRTEPGCRVSVDGHPIGLEENQVYKLQVKIQQGVNPHLVTVHCTNGHIEFLLVEIHWTKRSSGGDLVLAPAPRTLATCTGPPPGEIPHTTSVDLACRLGVGVVFTIGSRQKPITCDKEQLFRVRLEVESGPNSFPVRLSYGFAKGLTGEVGWMVSPFRWTGALLGAVAYGYGEGSSFIGGKLRGNLWADLPLGLKLILGSHLESSGKKELDAMDILGPAWNPWRHESDPDPEDGYLMPGDEALVSDDNPTSSRYLVRLKRRSSFLGFGGFETHNGANWEIGTYRRALVGPHAAIHPLEDLFLGSEPTLDLSLEAFYATPEKPQAQNIGSLGISYAGETHQVPAHEEFTVTGGTLYFLNHGWVVEGSERLQVHRRDLRTGLTFERRTLRRGVDYQLDWRSGRILLVEPLGTFGMSGEVVRLFPMSTTATVLVADYEHVETEKGLAQDIVGGRSAITLRPIKGISVVGAFSAVGQGLDQAEYRLLKGEARVRFGDRGVIWAAYGTTEGKVLTPAYSVDGGLSFSTVPEPGRSSGEAYEAGATLRLPSLEGQLLFRRWLNGYADTNLLANRDMTQILAMATTRPGSGVEIVGRFSGTEQNADRLLESTLGFRWKLMQDFVVATEAALEMGNGQFGEGHRAIAGLKAAYQPLPWLTLTAGHQQTLLADGEGLASRDITITSAGGQLQLWDRYHVGLEGGFGPTVGNLLGISLREEKEGGGEVFAHTTFSLEHDALKSGTLVTGQAVPAENGSLVTSSNTFSLERGQSVRGQQVGLEVPISRPWRMKLTYERAELTNPGDPSVRRDLVPGPFFDRGVWQLSGPGRRNVVHARVSYLIRRLMLSASGEYRVDEHLPLANQNIPGFDTRTSHRQTVLTLAARWMVSEGLTLGGRIAWAETFGLESGARAGGAGEPEGGFFEASLGCAFRPTAIDWISFLLRAAAGHDSRPEQTWQTAPGWHLERWLTGSLALLLRPSKYFQPTIIVAPWIFDLGYSEELTADKPSRTSLVGMIRIGSEIYAGLGVSSELRTLVGEWKAETIPPLNGSGLRAGVAAEIFYLIESAQFGGLRIGVGYSFSDLPDPILLSDLRSGRQGFFVRLEGML